jgi:nicotinic acid mononucleotide adenylyltransferase
MIEGRTLYHCNRRGQHAREQFQWLTGRDVVRSMTQSGNVREKADMVSFVCSLNTEFASHASRVAFPSITNR